MITYENVCKKLGFDFIEDWAKDENKSVHETDGLDSPYLKLTIDEAKFAFNYIQEIKITACLLAAIKAGERQAVFNINLVACEILKTNEVTRDKLAIKLQNDGYIEGLVINDNNLSIMWNASRPQITLKGYEYIDNSSSIKKAFKELKSIGVSTAAQIVSNTISNWSLK